MNMNRERIPMMTTTRIMTTKMTTTTTGGSVIKDDEECNDSKNHVVIKNCLHIRVIFEGH